MKASHGTRFSKTRAVAQFFRTRLVCDAHGRSTAQEFTPRSIEGSMRTKISPVLDIFVSVNQCPALTLKCRHQAFQSPSVHGEDTSKPLQIHIGETRWNPFGYSGRISHEPKMFSKEFSSVLRSEAAFHDVDGACVWTSVTQKVRKRLPNFHPNLSAEQWLEQLKLCSSRVHVGTCGYNSDDSTPGCIRAGSRSLHKTSCEPRVLEQHDRNTAWVNECNLWF